MTVIKLAVAAPSLAFKRLMTAINSLALPSCPVRAKAAKGGDMRLARRLCHPSTQSARALARQVQEL